MDRALRSGFALFGFVVLVAARKDGHGKEIFVKLLRSRGIGEGRGHVWSPFKARDGQGGSGAQDGCPFAHADVI